MIEKIFRIKKIVLVAGDIAAFYFSIIAGLAIRYGFSFTSKTLIDHLVYFTYLLPFSALIFYANSLYDLGKNKNTPVFYLAVLKSVIANFLVFTLFFYFTRPGEIPIAPKSNLLIFSFIFFVLLLAWRYGYNKLLASPVLKKNMAIIGDSLYDERLAREIKDHPELGYEIKMVLKEKDLNGIVKTMANSSIGVIVLGFNAYNSPEIIKLLYGYRNSGREFASTIDFYEKIIQKIPLFALSEIWFLENANEQKALYDFLKRVLDIVLAILAGAVFLILFIPIALAIKIDSKGGVFYRQKRVGKGGKGFVLVKFRSMVEDAEAGGAKWTESNDLRITRVGKIIRKIRIDELPQVINIIKGEMSFVGPRPERPEFQKALKEKNPFYAERNLIKPGLTGWAQTIYRYTSTVDESLEKLEYDLYYVKNRSFSLDLAIILKTINIILEKKGR